MFPMDAVAVLTHAVVAVTALRLHAETDVLIQNCHGVLVDIPETKSGQEQKIRHFLCVKDLTFCNSVLIIIEQLQALTIPINI